jgi:hypothetical protein
MTFRELRLSFPVNFVRGTRLQSDPPSGGIRQRSARRFVHQDIVQANFPRVEFRSTMSFVTLAPSWTRAPAQATISVVRFTISGLRFPFFNLVFFDYLVAFFKVTRVAPPDRLPIRSFGVPGRRPSGKRIMPTKPSPPPASPQRIATGKFRHPLGSRNARTLAASLAFAITFALLAYFSRPVYHNDFINTVIDVLPLSFWGGVTGFIVARNLRSAALATIGSLAGYLCGGNLDMRLFPLMIGASTGAIIGVSLGATVSALVCGFVAYIDGEVPGAIGAIPIGAIVGWLAQSIIQTGIAIHRGFTTPPPTEAGSVPTPRPVVAQPSVLYRLKCSLKLVLLIAMAYDFYWAVNLFSLLNTECAIFLYEPDGLLDPGVHINRFQRPGLAALSSRPQRFMLTNEVATNNQMALRLLDYVDGKLQAPDDPTKWDGWFMTGLRLTDFAMNSPLTPEESKYWEERFINSGPPDRPLLAKWLEWKLKHPAITTAVAVRFHADAQTDKCLRRTLVIRLFAEASMSEQKRSREAKLHEH